MDMNKQKKLFTLKFVDGEGVLSWNKELLDEKGLTPESFLKLYASYENALNEKDYDFKKMLIPNFESNNEIKSIKQFAPEISNGYEIKGHYNKLESFYSYLKINVPKIEMAMNEPENKKIKQDVVNMLKKQDGITLNEVDNAKELVLDNEFNKFNGLVGVKDDDVIPPYVLNKNNISNNIANARIKDAVKMGADKASVKMEEKESLDLNTKKELFPEEYDIMKFIAVGDNNKVREMTQSGMDLNFAGGAPLILAGNMGNSEATKYLLDGGANPDIIGDLRFGNACDIEIRNKYQEQAKYTP